MNVELNYSLVLDNELLEKFDFEGILISPLEPQNGLFVLSSNDDSFTLHIYKLQLNDEFEYHIDKQLTIKTFKSKREMQYFIDEFSNYNSDDFIDFLKNINKELH
jgi:hypothetical protein